MPEYLFKAITKTGERITGSEIAKNEADIARVLHEKGQVLIEATPVGQKKVFFFSQVFSGFFGVSLPEKLLFMRNLKLMIASGIPLPRALDVLKDQARSIKFKRALSVMGERIMKGDQLSSAMADHPSIFSDLFVNMVRVGEESGTMEVVLGQLAFHVEREHDLKSKIQGALMYPAVILVAMFGIGILMLIVVVPSLAKTFAELGADLPPTTKFVINLGNFFLYKWFIALPLFVVVSMGVIAALKTKRGKRMLDTVSLNIPIVSELVRKIQTAFTSRTLSSLVGAGVPIVRSLEITSSVLGNQEFREALAKAAEEVKKGARLSDALSTKKHLYPGVLVQMVRVGEETGQTGEILGKLAEFYEEEVGNLTKNLASIIEPLLMLFIGGVVGFFAVSMISPMYTMLGSVQ